PNNPCPARMIGAGVVIALRGTVTTNGYCVVPFCIGMPLASSIERSPGPGFARYRGTVMCPSMRTAMFVATSRRTESMTYGGTDQQGALRRGIAVHVEFGEVRDTSTRHGVDHHCRRVG